MQTNLLKAKMMANGINQEALSKLIGKSLSTLNGKINGKVEFDALEIKNIKNVLNLTSEETDAIFFD